MYHYIPGGDRSSLGEVLWGDPEEIRDEITLIRELLRKTQANMSAAEQAKEELLLSLSDSEHPDAERVRQLESVVESCEEAKSLLEDLWQRADTLSEELSDTLWWLRGATA